MSGDEWAVAIIESDDGIILLGDEHALVAFESQSGVIGRPVGRRVLAGAGKALGVVGEVQANSGRWVKLTKESAGLLRKHGAARSSVDNLMTGVVRGGGGKIVKHLKFENFGLLTPAAPMMLASLLTQASLEAALDDISEYLKVIDEKLDRLLKQRKVEALGQLGGVTLAIEEANTIYAHTGKVSAVTWSKVQGNSLALQTMQAESVAQLHAIADRVKEKATDTDRSAEVLAEVRGDVSFWLGILARTIALQDRQYVIELARVAETEPEQLEDHRTGINIARGARTTRIVQSLDAINASIRATANLTNFKRVANPFSAQWVSERASEITLSVADFARSTELDLARLSALDKKSWGGAARALLGEAADQVGTTSNGVASRARSVGSGLQNRRDEAVLRLAQRVQERRGADADSAGGNPEEQPAG